MSTIPLLLAAGIIAGVLVLILHVAGQSRPDGFNPYDYRPKPLLSAWERRVLSQLVTELPAGLHVCPQVRLADLLSVVERNPARRRAALGRVAQKSVDFVVVDGRGEAVLVIELDVRSHGRSDRAARDAMVDAVLGQCRIPLLRLRPGQRVDVRPYLGGNGRLRAA